MMQVKSTTVKVTPRQGETAKRQLDKLRSLAYKAMDARSNLEDALDALKSDPKVWERFCQVTGTPRDTDYGDWTC